MYFRDLLFNSKPNPGYIAINATYGAAVVQGANAKPPKLAKPVGTGASMVYSGGGNRRGSSAGSFVNGAQYGVPVWGSCLQFQDALNSGDYLNAASFFGLGFFEAFTLGGGTEVRLGMNAAKVGSRVFEVGSYNTLRGAEIGLDAHHVGQKALMSKFVPGYNSNIAPSILVPQLGHTQGIGVLSRGMSEFTNARQVLARDIFELRRVYPDIPNNSLQQLIQMNKSMYTGSFLKW